MHRHLDWMVRTISLLLIAAFAQQADAVNGVVGPGNCNYAGFSSVLSTVDGSGGGTITFNCGTATITFAGYKQVSNAVVIDGGGTITFDGGNSSAFFQIFGSATLVLKRLTLQHGEFSSAHALENFGFLRLDQVKMQNNVSIGAPILNQNSLIVERSTFSANVNTGTGADGHGGAIRNDGGSATIRYSTFTGNQAATGGGAISSTSDLDVADSTFTGNSTTGAGSGGAAIEQTGGIATVMYSTITGNTGQTFGGGIYSNDPAVLTVSRSIIANNTNGNCDGSSTALVSAGYNVWFGATSCSFLQPGDGSGNPMLGALANNGGATQTLLPAAGSAAINRIPNAQCMLPYDQRGATRPGGIANSSCDSGAVEAGAAIDLIFYDSFE
ncbi:choice-of-anchor Q domain-containing protein [Dokdonella sp.]|uniref:choice-of-anchor Q domain-containing protein n=1 Tax=Dokdonella sp. TaxID=2291710 RepID=UPI003783A261